MLVFAEKIKVHRSGESKHKRQAKFNMLKPEENKANQLFKLNTDYLSKSVTKEQFKSKKKDLVNL